MFENMELSEVQDLLNELTFNTEKPAPFRIPTLNRRGLDLDSRFRQDADKNARFDMYREINKPENLEDTLIEWLDAQREGDRRTFEQFCCEYDEENEEECGKDGYFSVSEPSRPYVPPHRSRLVLSDKTARTMVDCERREQSCPTVKPKASSPKPAAPAKEQTAPKEETKAEPAQKCEVRTCQTPGCNKRFVDTQRPDVQFCRTCRKEHGKKMRAEREVRLARQKEYAATYRVRFCSNVTCNRKFLDLEAPHEATCRQCRDKQRLQDAAALLTEWPWSIRPQRQQEALASMPLPTAKKRVWPQSPKNSKVRIANQKRAREQAVRTSLVNGRPLPPGAVLKRNDGRQAIVVLDGHSITVHKPHRTFPITL